jgi:hypothetical protein
VRRRLCASDEYHSDKLRKALYLHFRHDIGPMDFHTTFADAKPFGSNLTGLPGDDGIQDQILRVGQSPFSL